MNHFLEQCVLFDVIFPGWKRHPLLILNVLRKLMHRQAKEVVKGIRKRLRSKNPKSLILVLTLLETVMMNCGDIIHMHVAHKNIPHKMVKIARKKPDFRVREKILILIDTWQEAFGGPRARYPQYYFAYQDLLHAGAIFPKRSETSAPLFTPLQTHPLAIYSPDPHNPDDHQGAIESTEDSEFPTLSLTEIQNARGIMDVLAEMLNALDTEKKEVVRQEVIIDLVQQCRTYKQRVVHLINSTSEESLLCQGLALNDDLQRLLAKHEAIASGTSDMTEKSNSTMQSLIDIGDPEVTTEDNSKQPDGRPAYGTNAVSESPVDLLLPASSSSGPVDPKIDLLSTDDFLSPEPEHSLALVPVGEPQPTSPSTQQDFLALAGIMPPNDVAENSLNPQQDHTLGEGRPPMPQLQEDIYSNGIAIDRGIPQDQQLQLSGYGIHENGALPPPPWETQLEDDANSLAIHDPHQMQIVQVLYTDKQPVHNGGHSQMMVADPATGMYVQVGMHPLSMQHNQSQGYGPQTQFLEQSMHGLSMRDNTANSSHDPSSLSYAPSGKPSKPEDKLFGDLVSIARSKPNKSSSGTA